MSRIRNPTWQNDENLKADIQKYVLQNLTRKEVLDFLGRDYPQYAWSLPTLSRGMAYFEIKYVDYKTDLKVVELAVKEEISALGVPINAPNVARAPPVGSSTRLGERCDDEG